MTVFPELESLNDATNLQEGEIHLWEMELDVSDEELTVLFEYLSEPEKTRARRFHFPHLHQRFIVRRARLRQILSCYLEQCPSEIDFEYSDTGKPFFQGKRLKFNMSSSRNRALLACCLDFEIGVDIEKIRPMPDQDDLVSAFFSKQEQQSWNELCTQERFEAFFVAWTRKEAFVKALGTGLGFGLDQFSVGFDKEDNRLLSVQHSIEKHDQWRLLHFQPIPDFSAALACYREVASVKRGGCSLLNI